jgi:hypothetical protein
MRGTAKKHEIETVNHLFVRDIPILNEVPLGKSIHLMF